MSGKTFYELCRIVVNLRLRGMTDQEIDHHLFMADLDADEIEELMDLTRGSP